MKIEFSTINAAFDDYGDLEIERILEEIINKVKHGYSRGTIIDVNGNKIGWWKL